jgi:hypothetical protein
MTVALFLRRVNRSGLILRGVPIHLQVVSLTLFVQRRVHVDDNLAIGAALHGQHFTRVIVA